MLHMKNLLPTLPFRPILLVLGLLLASTATTLQSCSPRFDAIGSQYVNTLASALPDLMGKATGSFADHKADVEKLLADVAQAATHAAAIKRNREVAESWKLLQNDLVAPFFNSWKDKGKLDKDFVKEASAQVKKSLAAIKRAEDGKRK
jgi:hypothetical protein